MARMCGCSGQCMDKPCCPAMPRFDLANESKPKPVSKRPPPPTTPYSDCGDRPGVTERSSYCWACNGDLPLYCDECRSPAVTDAEATEDVVMHAWRTAYSHPERTGVMPNVELVEIIVRAALEAAAAVRKEQP